MSIQYGILHNHSEFSVKDSAMKLESMFERAKSLGAPAIALTDHGILAGFYDFMNLSKAYGIKAIPGIEAYYVSDPVLKGKWDEEQRTQKQKRLNDTKQHLILMAKDIDGYHAICDAVYRSYSNLSGGYPRMTRDILQSCFGPAAAGHGHVIATSACVGGILSELLLETVLLAKETASLYKRRDKYHPVDAELLDVIKQEEDLLNEIATLVDQRTKLDAESKTDITGMRRALRALSKDSADYTRIEKELEVTKARKDDAKVALDSVKKQLAAKRKEKSVYSKEISAMKASAERWTAINGDIESIMSAARSDEELRDITSAAALDFQSIFGKGNFYIELQYHGIDKEATAMPILASIAKETGIPIVAANDAHYATNSREDIRAHTLTSAMRFNTEIKPDVELSEGYGELYIKTDSELKDALSAILDEETISQAMQNIGTVVDACNVELKEEKHYPVFVGGAPGETPSQRLRRLAEESISKKYPGSAWTAEYKERLEYELGVIDRMGYSDYLCIVQDFLAYGRSLAYDCPEKIGYTIGPGRGSAVGSIVCYLSGITSVDPMKYGLLFERFLNPERVSMPDIDSDFHTEIRGQVIDYVKAKYGERAVCNILTKGTMAGRSAIRSVGRVTNVPDSIVDTVAKMVPSIPNAKISDATGLDELCMSNPIVQSLVEDAKLIEDTIVIYGMHAAGVIISDNGDVGKYVAMMYNDEKEQWVAQCDMGQCESEAGLLKMDFLGLRNLDIITDTLRRVKRNCGIGIDIESVDLEPEVFRNIFAKGNTNSIFQFESGGMKDMLRRFRPDSMEDIVLLVAAYRPGPMQSIPDIIKVKHGEITPNYIAKGLAEILDVTYGYPIYQEQVMQIFNKVAGFSLGESDIIRRAMSKKKLKILTDPETDYHGKFIRGLQANGASEENAEAFWERLLDFAAYAFNKSHAAAYAFVAYYTAWLKYHYPAEYMCSVMTRTGFDKLPMLVNECKHMGLRIDAPDINRSMNGFMNIDNTVLFGFGNIKGVGNSGKEIIQYRVDDGPYRSAKDFILRTASYVGHQNTIGKSVVSTLIEAGAFDLFCGGNRRTLLEGLEDLTATAKKLCEQQAKTISRSQSLVALSEAAPPDEAAIKKAASGVKTAKEAERKHQTMFDDYVFLPVFENRRERLNREHELLGAYVTGSPMDEYADSIKLVPNVTTIDVLEADTKVTMCGIVSAIRVFQRKSDGLPFCSMTLFDQTGEIEVKVFTKQYGQVQDLIVEGAALTVVGQVRDEDGFSPEADPTRIITALDVKKLVLVRHERFLITARTIADWCENYNDILTYRQDDGYELYFHDGAEGSMRRCVFLVSEDILNLSKENLLISKMPV